MQSLKSKHSDNRMISKWAIAIQHIPQRWEYWGAIAPQFSRLKGRSLVFSHYLTFAFN
ncbi:MAG: hypothetical protein HC840_06375 [Leptolyngbyaceae cyanobacterium RM2_2_4]|nr:hypothetical protein [Leptolyngbyaceae cyanobacterium RM2_2_4]